MRFIKQTGVISVKNYDQDLIKKCEKYNKKHGKLLPSSIRCLVIGSSGSGKTNVTISLLLNPNGLFFENVYIYSKTLEQCKYQLLKKIFSQVKEVGYYTYSEKTQITPPNRAKPNSIFIFDDVCTENQNIIRDFFARGRHAFVDCFYLCQTYTMIPKQLIRDNANFLIIFKQDFRNLKYIYDEHVNTDMSLKKFLKMCSLCWENSWDFLVIDKTREIKQGGRYRRGFNEFIQF